jgi:hypothetical protein
MAKAKAPAKAPRRNGTTKEVEARPPTVATGPAPRAMGAAEEVDASPPTAATSPAPRTMEQAHALAYSNGAHALLDLAAAVSQVTKPSDRGVSAGDLFRALLVAGQRQVGQPTASRWLFEWITTTTKRDINSELERFANLGSASSAEPVVPLSDNAGAILLRAAAIAKATVNRDRFDTRHVAAALTLPDESGANQNVLNLGQRLFGVDLTQYPQRLMSQIAADPERNESMAAWRAVLAQSPVTPGSGVRTAVVNINADRVSNTETDKNGKPVDPLGIQADVNAFARLICLEQATPPLSIGVFGAWGSGKSSFMERLQLAIAGLTRQTREKRLGEVAGIAEGDVGSGAALQPRFIENVVQIRFNAWHYSDANLWACLTAEFFDQLRRGGYEGQRSSDYLALIGKVAERVRSLESSAQKAHDALADAERAAREADEALVAARKKLGASDRALASEHLQQELENIRNDKDNAAKLRDVGSRIYREDLGKDLDTFTAAVSGAATIPGRFALICRVILAGGWPTAFGVLAVILVAVVGIGWRTGDPAALAALIQRVVGASVSPEVLGLAQRVFGIGGGAFAALGAIWRATKTVTPILDGAFAYAKAVEIARKQLMANVQEKDDLARKAAEALTTARAASDAAKKPLANYGKGAVANAPGTILRYFLFEDGDIRDYDKHIGLVSRARRSFEQLDAIFAAARDGRRAQEKRNVGGKAAALNEQEKAALDKCEAMQLDVQSLEIPDRIVIYIDDLDRCTHAQVFEVLQAIHLLLAFELFVVVAGVDVLWVEESVSRQFAPADIASGGDAAERRAAEVAKRRRAIEYLEKISSSPSGCAGCPWTARMAALIGPM